MGVTTVKAGFAYPGTPAKVISTETAAQMSRDSRYDWTMERAELALLSDAVSTDWRTPHADIYTIKGKGTRGDVLVQITNRAGV